MFKKTDCKKCAGWGNSCSSDFFADYIRDPNHCEYFISLSEQTDWEISMNQIEKNNLNL